MLLSTAGQETQTRPRSLGVWRSTLPSSKVSSLTFLLESMGMPVALAECCSVETLPTPSPSTAARPLAGNKSRRHFHGVSVRGTAGMTPRASPY